jgi:hypothetical protein
MYVHAIKIITVTHVSLVTKNVASKNSGLLATRCECSWLTESGKVLFSEEHNSGLESAASYVEEM